MANNNILTYLKNLKVNPLNIYGSSITMTSNTSDFKISAEEGNFLLTSNNLEVSDSSFTFNDQKVVSVTPFNTSNDDLNDVIAHKEGLKIYKTNSKTLNTPNAAGVTSYTQSHVLSVSQSENYGSQLSITSGGSLFFRRSYETTDGEIKTTDWGKIYSSVDNSITYGTEKNTSTSLVLTNENSTVSLWAGQQNIGVYDNAVKKWIIYTPASSSDGTQKKTFIPNWKSTGSSSTFVYFNEDGQPVEGKTFYIRTSVPSTSIGSDGDLCFVYSTS